MNKCKPLPDGTRLACATSDHTVRVWDLTTGYGMYKWTRGACGVCEGCMRGVWGVYEGCMRGV